MVLDPYIGYIMKTEIEYKLEVFQDELDADLKIDGTQLQYETQNNVLLHSKWLRLYTNCKKEIMRLEIQKKTALKKRLDHYTGRGDPGEEVCMDVYEKSELKTVMAADSSVLKIDTSIQYWTLLQDFCSAALDGVKSRSFALKHMLEIRQFEAGK
ncbi:UvsY-like recombination mediator [Escherichia phage vB_EcoM_RZ]|uniref:Recombination, repair and ssDNA binding protein n=1 Tax=Escherichia phage vB_EcoM_RZ TaxID=2893954 RepID=A0AAE8YIN4_9CAUD|nr:UvsY-like recombination mediator [Escherichia phage vB_EcoM_RZ]QMV33822.1 recombination repair and ssDNA binding protein [Escherichia phage DK-13]UGL60041.1 recombination, repair and ssDNA binding protein [Escherichia phage vB_EcoM_RZ]